MKARVKATGLVSEVCPYSPIYLEGVDNCFYPDEVEIVDTISDSPDYWTRLEHQYAGQFMQAMISSSYYTDLSEKAMADASLRIAHALVEKVRYEENPKELEGLKIEKTILENKIKLLTEERK